MDEKLYRRLKRELPPKGISAFIEIAVRERLFPERRVLDAAYRKASAETWRRRLGRDWSVVDTEGWPE
jgi:hypothetical protein